MMSSQKYIIANWKMHPPTIKEAFALYRAVRKNVPEDTPHEIVLCPPSVYLEALDRERVESGDKKILFGAQNCFWEETGAYTGEVSASMLRTLGCDFVILGHSERRIYLGETDEMVNKKIKAAMAAKLRPILCIGENDEEHRGGQTRSILERQIHGAFNGVDASLFVMSSPLLVYEPIWAISGFNGKAASWQDTKEAVGWIFEILTKTVGDAAQHTPILYGGSITYDTIHEHVKEAGTDGVLVGGASLKAEEFGKIIQAVNGKP